MLSNSQGQANSQTKEKGKPFLKRLRVPNLCKWGRSRSPSPPPPSATSPRPPPSSATANPPSQLSPPSSSPAQSIPVSPVPVPLAAPKSPPGDAGAIAADVLQALGPAEIRSRTHELLERRLGQEELKRLGWDQFRESTAERAQNVVQEVKTCLDRKKEHTEKVHKILQYVNEYCIIVDVAVQHQPQITALVWAGIRTCIQVCVLIISLLYIMRRPSPNLDYLHQLTTALSSWQQIPTKHLTDLNKPPKRLFQHS
jgi:hypothetical protein